MKSRHGPIDGPTSDNESDDNELRRRRNQEQSGVVGVEERERRGTSLEAREAKEMEERGDSGMLGAPSACPWQGHGNGCP